MNMGGGGEKDESKMTTRILARTGTCMVVSITESVTSTEGEVSGVGDNDELSSGLPDFEISSYPAGSCHGMGVFTTQKR